MLLNRQNLLICELCGPDTPYLEVQPEGTTLAMNAFAAASVTAPNHKLVKYRKMRVPKMPIFFHCQEAELMRTEAYKLFRGKDDGRGGYQSYHVAIGKAPRFVLYDDAIGNEAHDISPRQADVPTGLALPSEMVFDQYIDAVNTYVEVPFMVSHVHEELERVRRFLGYVRKYDRKHIVSQCVDLYVRKIQWRGCLWHKGMTGDPFAAVLNALPLDEDVIEDYLDQSLRKIAGHWGKLQRKDLEDRRRYVHVRLNFVLLKRIIRLTKSFMSNDKAARAQVFVPIQRRDHKDKIRPLVIRAVNERTGQTFVAAQMPIRPSY